MAVLYLISKYATVFGTLIKGLWEHITCGILKLFVEDGRYLEPTEMCGHVEHELPQNKFNAFMICFLPSLINALLAVFLGGAGFMGLFILGVDKSVPVFWIYLVLYYIGISFFCNIFPLVEDAMNNWSRLYHSGLTDEDKARNEEIKRKQLENKAREKEAMKAAKEKAKEKKGSAPVKIKKSADGGEQIKSDTNIIAKILLFIPSAILYGGAFLEKYCVTFIISIIGTILAIVLM